MPLRYRDGESERPLVETFPVPAGPPRFAARPTLPGHTVGLMVRDEATGAACAFVPGCGELDAGAAERLAERDLVLFDGTFWTDDELIRLGIGDRTAREMDHLPISGPRRQPGAALRQLHARTGLHPHQQHQSRCCSRIRPSGLQSSRPGCVVGDGRR